MWDSDLTDEDFLSIEYKFEDESKTMCYEQATHSTALPEGEEGTPEPKQPSSHVARTSPMVDLHLRYLWVSLLTEQVWCERKMLYQFQVPPEVEIEEAPQIQSGKAIHLIREMEVQTTVVVKSTSREDSFAIKVLNLLLPIKSLMAGTPVRREIYVFGLPYDTDIFIVGVIDELRMDRETFQLDIVELKTRVKKTLPSKSQKVVHQLQAMLYKRMFDDLILGKVTKEDVAKHVKMDINKKLGEDVVKSIPQEYCCETLGELLDHTFALMRSLPFISNIMVEYQHQGDMEIFALEGVTYDETYLDSTFHQCIQYWKGERGACGVDVEDAWKCGMCEFNEICDWRIMKSKELETKNASNFKNTVK